METNFESQIEEIRKIRHEKYLASTKSTKQEEKPEYNYDARKDMLNYIKKCSKSDVLKERMDRIEKLEYKNKISKIIIGDLEHFTQNDLDINFMTELFKFSHSIQVLQTAYEKFNSKPNFLMIKELLAKSNLQEDFLLTVIKDYTKTNKNVLQIITTTCILESEFAQVKEYLLELFYSNSNTPAISYEQLKKIYMLTNPDPLQFKFMVSKCSNKSGYSKCSKTFIERSNRDLIKNLIHEMETKYKCKLDLDLYD